MAAFFAWGNVPNSFVVANGSLLDYQNMPADYEGRFKMNEWNAMQLKAFHTGPNDYHWAATPNGHWSARGPQDMMPFLQTQVVTVGANGYVQPGRGRANFVAFGLDGLTWFIRYDSNQSWWGPDPANFPGTWRALIQDLEKTHPRKDEFVAFVAFGLHEMLLVRFENGNSHMALPENPTLRSRISPELIKEVEDRLAAGWTLGNRTTLCSFDTNRYFLEWKRGTMAVFSYNMGNGEGCDKDLERVKKVLSGEGSNSRLVADNQAAQLITASSAFAQQVALSRIL